MLTIRYRGLSFFQIRTYALPYNQGIQRARGARLDPDDQPLEDIAGQLRLSEYTIAVLVNNNFQTEKDLSMLTENEIAMLNLPIRDAAELRKFAHKKLTAKPKSAKDDDEDEDDQRFME